MAGRNAGYALAGGLLLLTAHHCLAADDTGFYLGGSFGATRIDASTASRDLENELVATGFSSADAQFDEKSTGVKILAGYQVNRNFAVEGYLANLGKYNISVLTTGPTVTGSGDIKLKGIGFDAVGIYPLNDKWSLLGRVGLFLWDSKLNFTASGGGSSNSVSGTDDGSELKFGVGLEWKLGASVGLRGELEYYNFEETLTMLSFGLVYRFQ